MKIDALPTEYVPGVCNIGKEERAQRTLVGLVALVVSLALATIFIVAHVSWLVRLVVFIPAAVSAVGLIQSAFHFCVKFGMAGVFNFGAQVGKTQNVADDESKQKDMAKVRLILVLSLLAAAVFTAIVVAIE